jgi:hypothetical protein
MTNQKSFTKYEHKVLPNFRQQISKAESTEDVKKFFVYTARELFEEISDGNLDIEYEDIALNPHGAPQYTVSGRLLSNENFASVWKDSDLPAVVSRLAESAMSRYKHLEKHPEKTSAKIRM